MPPPPLLITNTYTRNSQYNNQKPLQQVTQQPKLQQQLKTQYLQLTESRPGSCGFDKTSDDHWGTHIIGDTVYLNIQKVILNIDAHDDTTQMPLVLLAAS